MILKYSYWPISNANGSNRTQLKAKCCGRGSGVWFALRSTSQSQLALKEKMPDRKPFSRLPKDVIPKNYAMLLEPDLSKFTFEGQQAITVQVSLCCIAMGGAPIGAGVVIPPTFLHRGGQGVHKFMTTNQYMSTIRRDRRYS